MSFIYVVSVLKYLPNYKYNVHDIWLKFEFCTLA